MSIEWFAADLIIAIVMVALVFALIKFIKEH